MKKPKKNLVANRVGFFNGVVKDGKITVVGKKEYLALRRKGKLHFLEKEINKCLFNIKVNIVQIGIFLTIAKKQLGHGNFKPWIEATFGDDLPYKTAYVYRKIYLELRDYPDVIDVLPISFMIHMTQKSFPGEIRKLIESNPTAFSKGDIRTVEKAYKDFKNNDITLEELKEQTALQIKMGIAVLEGKQIAKNKRRTLLPYLDELMNFTKLINNQIAKVREIYLSRRDNGGFISPELNTEMQKNIAFTIERLQELRVETEKSNN